MDNSKITKELYDMCIQKREGKTKFSWDSINSNFDFPFSNGENLRCWIRKKVKKESNLPSRDQVVNTEVQKKLDDVDLQILNLRKEKVKLQDLKTSINKLVRDKARQEDFYDFISREILNLNEVKPLVSIDEIINYNINPDCEHNSAILQLSDWHKSIYIDNFINEFNSEIFKSRIDTLIKKSIEFGYMYNIEELVVALQGDFISGIIHDNLRIQNQEDLISQIISTSETIAEVLSALSLHFKIRVSSVTDNHSRVSQNKEKSIDDENYIRITEWFLKTRLKDNANIKFIENELGHEISTFKIYDFNFGSTHGHRDSFQNVVQSLSTYTRELFDFILISHFHHLHIEEINYTTILCNGSLAGTDEYANSVRKASRPMQLFTIYNKDYGLSQICPIYF